MFLFWFYGLTLGKLFLEAMVFGQNMTDVELDLHARNRHHAEAFKSGNFSLELLDLGQKLSIRHAGLCWRTFLDRNVTLQDNEAVSIKFGELEPVIESITLEVVIFLVLDCFAHVLGHDIVVPTLKLHDR